MERLVSFLKEQPRWQLAEHAALAVLGGIVLRRAYNDFSLQSLLSAVPGAKALVASEMAKEVDKAVAEMFPPIEGAPAPVSKLPAKRTPRGELREILGKLKKADSKSHGKTFAYIYLTDSSHEEITEEAFSMFMHENALNPAVFPSLRRMENEVVQMASQMFHAPEGYAGNMTSGGTESILCAVKAMREYAREKRPHVTQPNMIAATTVHPAFEKAAHYFGIEIRHVEIRDDCSADIDGFRAAADANTIFMVVSAPQYPHGIIDPVEEAAALALELDVPLHVDSCIGGFVLPWIEKLGYEVPKWDFRVKGVTSISADVHKYGYAPKGASVVLFRTHELRNHMFFAYARWPGGLFVSPSLLGTRGGGAIAGAWASMMALGEEGFLELTQQVMDAKKHFSDFVKNTDGLEAMGNSNSSILSFRSSDPEVNILAVADVMESEFGWKIDRQQLPATLHLTIMPIHYARRELITEHFAKSLEIVRKNPAKYNNEGSANMYGMVAKVGGLSQSLLDDFLVRWMDKVFTFGSEF